MKTFFHLRKIHLNRDITTIRVPIIRSELEVLTIDPVITCHLKEYVFPSDREVALNVALITSFSAYASTVTYGGTVSQEE